MTFPETPAGKLGFARDVYETFYETAALEWEGLPWWEKLWRTVRGRRINPDAVRAEGKAVAFELLGLEDE